uniref:CUE domain-containing protein n=1 Tax=Arundo donax TaxID=35708 RepID=A0A0A9CUS8_ARUDO
MSAVVCGKRSSSIFADDLIASSSSPPSPPHHNHPSKRSRCSPTHAFDDAAVRRRESLLHHLLTRFPHMDPQLLERALEASGDNWDSAINSLNELRLESADAILSATVSESENGLSTVLKLAAEGAVSNGHLDVATENPPVTDNCQTSYHTSEWVELFVREMMSSSDIDDARARASRALHAFEKIIMERTGAEAVQNLHRENVMLKEQLALILRENAVLKRGVAIQHERQKKFDVRTQEVDSLKQLVSQYQEQLKTLEINNYALRVHLKQAQQNSSMPGRFPPDVF